MRTRQRHTNANTTDATKAEAPKAPDWIVKTPKGHGRKEKRLERIGSAWTREDGGICMRLYGTQIITADIYLFPLGDADKADG